MKKPPFTIPQCIDYSVIVNKSALSLMRSSDCQYSHTSLMVIPTSEDAVKRLLVVSKAVIANHGVDALEDYYVYTASAFQYVFVIVRCGKCPKCLHNKQVDLINRCVMESSCYDVDPYMITLTYRPNCLPVDRIPLLKALHCNSLYYKDVQDFFKRLRIRWTRKGLKHNIRYLVAGEYGHLHHRPHYHILLWNQPFDDSVIGYRQLYDDVFKAWSLCDASAFQCEPAEDGAASYVSKYLTKSVTERRSYFPAQPPFIHTSRLHGGVGAPLIDKDISYYRRNVGKTEFSFLRRDGQVITLPMTGYITSRLFPSPSRCLPSSYRRLFFDYRYTLQHAVDYGIFTVDVASDLLTLYSLGVLYYTDIKQCRQPNSQIMLNDAVIDVKQRIFSIIDDLQSSMQEIAQCLDLDASVYFAHKASVTSVNNDNSLAFAYQRVIADKYVAQSKEIL